MSVVAKKQRVWFGGYLNNAEIRANLKKLFEPGTVPDPEKQIQQAGIDLTLESIWRGGRQLIPTRDGWYYLPPGGYWVEFTERAIGSLLGLLIFPRSTLFRIGGTFDCRMAKFPMLYRGIIGGHLTVDNPFGLRLQQGVRLAQALVCSEGMKFKHPHQLEGRSEPLTVEKILAFQSEGVLGLEERGVQTEEVDEAQLLPNQGHMVRFKEVIKVSPSEVVFSWLDSPHSEERQQMFATRPVVSFWNFMTVMGAVADPGYVGQLNGCLHSPAGQVVTAGMTLLELQKYSITPIEDKSTLYTGKYQGTGVSGEVEETVIWHGPGWYPRIPGP